MGILLGDNFKYSAQKPLDGRIKYDTLADMKAVADATMYEGCLCYCVAADKTYQWKSSNTVDETTGKWREFSSGGGGGGGASNLSDLGDVDIDNPSDGQVLKYNSTTEKFENANESGGGGATVSGYAYAKPIESMEDFISRVNAISDFPDITYSSSVFSGKTANDICIFQTSSTYYLLFSEYDFDIAALQVSQDSTLKCSISRKTLDGSSHPGYRSTGALSSGITSLSSVTIAASWEFDTTITDASKTGLFFVTSDVGFDDRYKSYNDNTYILDGIQFYSDAEHTQLITPEMGKDYVDIATGEIYKWDGRNFSVVGSGSVTKDSIGLGNVVNTGDSATPVENGTTKFTTGGAYTLKEATYNKDDTAETSIADADYFPFYDSSASGKRKSLWSNIKSVLKTYFDSLYQKTLTAGTNISFSGTNNQTINASIPVLGTINRSDIYDTTEKVVGKWTDGRPIYQKVITGIMPTCATDGTAVTSYISIGTTVKDYINSYVRMYKSSAGNIIPLLADMTYTTEIEIKAARRARYTLIDNTNTSGNKNTIMLSNSYTGWNGYPVTAIVQYTKTTDAANSYNYASENDYSTSEKIIGTWIDGKTLYQQTYKLNVGNLVTTEGTAGAYTYQLPSNINVVSFDGYINNSNGGCFSFNRYEPVSDFNPSETWHTLFIAANKNLIFRANRQMFNNQYLYITLKYTKS